MYSDWVGLAVAGFLVVWLGGLTFFIWQSNVFLRSLFPKSGQRDIRVKFEEVLKQVLDFRQDLNKLNSKLSEVEQFGRKYVQRVQLSRYNPYDDTGGDQSFSLSLLDNKGNGVVLTSLNTRSGTRVFAKPVVLGRSSKHQFSDEEALVVKKTMEK